MNSMLLDTCTRIFGSTGESGRALNRVQPIHTRIPGRARFKIAALYRSQSVKHRLETQLRGVKGIRAAHGNELTGSLLVVFDRRRSVGDVLLDIAETLEKATPRAEVHRAPAVHPYRPNHFRILAEAGSPNRQAPPCSRLSVALVASSPLVLLPIIFLQTFLLGLLRGSPILLLFVTSIAILGLVVGKKEGWSRSEALYFAFATASTVGFVELRPTQTSTKILSIIIGLLGLLLTGMVTALGFLSAQRAFEALPR